MRDHIEKLLEAVDGISQDINDWDYMKLMTLLQQAYLSTPVPVQVAPSPAPYELDYYQLLSRHHRLKRANKRRFRAHRERVQALEQTIEELQNEITYLEQGQRPPLVICETLG